MPFYYINKNWTLIPGFHHEVHTEEHAAELKIQDKIYLGWFANEIDAVQEGKNTIQTQTDAPSVVPRHIRGERMPRKEHHVVPNPDGGWDVKRENAKRSSGHYDTKQEAMEAGRRMSINQGTELIPHRKDGTIQNPDSHGNDPCPPKDK